MASPLRTDYVKASPKSAIKIIRTPGEALDELINANKRSLGVARAPSANTPTTPTGVTATRKPESSVTSNTLNLLSALGLGSLGSVSAAEPLSAEAATGEMVGALGGSIGGPTGAGLGAATESATGIAPMGIGTSGALLGGTLAGQYLANKAVENNTNKTGQAAWGAINAMNPAYAAAKAVDEAKNVTSGKPISTGTAVGAAIPTAGASLLYNPLFASGQGIFGSSKGREQQARDQVRKGLQSSGILDKDYMLTLADNQTKFDVGKDAGAKLTNAAGEQRHQFDVDFGDKRASEVVGALNPLAAIISEGDEKLTSDFAGYFTNAALTSGDPEENARAFYKQGGYDRDKAYQAVLDLGDKIDPGRRDAYLAGIDKLFGVGQKEEQKEEEKPSKSSGEGGGGGSSKKTTEEEWPKPYDYSRPAPTYHMTDPGVVGSPYQAIADIYNTNLTQPRIRNPLRSRFV